MKLQPGRMNFHVVGDTKWRFGRKDCYLQQGNVKYTQDLIKLSTRACGILKEIVDISGHDISAMVMKYVKDLLKWSAQTRGILEEILAISQ